MQQDTNMDNRHFDSGAYRNSNEGKYDIEGFNCPMCLDVFYGYMHGHRKLEDGTMRDGDNWQAGIPNRELLKSALRHMHSWRMEERGFEELDSDENLLDHLCGIIFNSFARLHDTHNQEV